jgi:DNA-binding beta-propeller fold protein YncE
MKSVSRFFIFGIFLFSLLSAFIPFSAEAALVPCGRSTGTAAETAPCTACHIIVGGNGVIQYGLKIMTFVAIAVIVAMAILYIVSTGNEGMMQTAKSGIKAALIGFAVMLGAWLIVNTTLRILSVTVLGDLGITSSGFSFTCDTSSSAGTAMTTPASGFTPVVDTPPMTLSTSSPKSVDVKIPSGKTTAVPLISGDVVPTGANPVTVDITSAQSSIGPKEKILAFLGIEKALSAGADLNVTPGTITSTDQLNQGITIQANEGTPVDAKYVVVLKQAGSTVGTMNVTVTTPAVVAVVTTYTRTDYAAGASPTGITFDPSTNSIWVANGASNDVTKLSAATGAKLGTYPAGVGPYGIALDSTTNSIWVTNLGSSNVTKLNAATGATVGTYSVSALENPHFGIAFDSSTNSIWVPDRSSSAITKLNATTGATVGTYPVSAGTSPTGITFDPSTNSLWVTNVTSHKVTKLSAATGAVLGTYPVGTNPFGITFDPSTNSIWVVNSNSNNVTKLNAATAATLGTYAVGSFPQDAAFDPSTNSIWITNSISNNVTNLSAATGAVLGTYPVGTNPTGITFDSSTNSIWVANPNSDVTKLSPSSSVSPSDKPTASLTTNGHLSSVNVDPLVSHTWAWSSTNGSTARASAVFSLCDDPNRNGSVSDWTPWTDAGHSANATQSGGSNTSPLPGSALYGCKVAATYTVTNTAGQVAIATSTVQFKKTPSVIPVVNSFTVSPNPVTSGGTLTFNWSSNASFCSITANNGFSPPEPDVKVITNGPAVGSVTHNPDEARTYTLICKNSAGAQSVPSEIYVPIGASGATSFSMSPSAGTFDISQSNPATLVFTLSGATRGDLEACYEVMTHPNAPAQRGYCDDSAHFFPFDGNAEWKWNGSNLVGSFSYSAGMWGATGIQTKSVFRKKSAPTVQANSVITTVGTIAASNPNSNSCNPPATMTSSEKIDWFCSLPENKGPDCVGRATSLLPYISDYAKYPGLDVRGCAMDTSLPCGGFGPCY